MTDSQLITLTDLAAGYGRQPVLSGINLPIARGAFIGLLGANGSGKTTLLKTIAGILPAVAGRIEFHPAETVIGYVPQRESLDSSFLLSSAEIVEMGLCGRARAGRWLSRSDRSWARECLERTGTGELARKPFAQLSGGQKQKVLIARALAVQPDVLLLDEPTAGIDPTSTESIAALLTELHRGGLTILMANHELPVVRRVTDTLIWVRKGAVTQGRTSELLKQEAVNDLT